MINKIKALKLRYFVIFLVIIWLFTSLSNFIAYYTLPQVVLAQGYSGPLTLRINSEVEVISSKLSYEKAMINGGLSEILVQEGDQVKEDTALYQYVIGDIEEQIKKEKNELKQLAYDASVLTIRSANTSSSELNKRIEESEKTLAKLKLDYENKSNLFNLGSVSQSDLLASKDTYLKGIEEHKERVNNLKISQLENEKNQIRLQEQIEEKKKSISRLEAIKANDGKVFASQKGVVKKVISSVGDTMAKGQNIIGIEDADGERLVKVSTTKDIAKYYKNGDVLSITVPGFEDEAKGIVKSISQDKQVKNQRILTLVIEADQTIPSGKQVQVYGNKKSQSYPVLVPKHALVTENRKSYVWMVKEVKKGFGTEQRLEKVLVITGDKDKDTMVIKSGITQEDLIVTSVANNKSLSQGIRVIIKSQE